MTVAPSLFDGRAGDGVLATAGDWVTGTLLGDLSIGLCVVAVAFVGLMLMTGRLAIRDGLRVAIGCFVLLGAPVIAAGLRGTADKTAAAGSLIEPTIAGPSPTAPLPPATYDPYAGASLRRD